jgi:hypothetical protein
VLGLALGAELVSITLVPPLTVFGRSTIPLGELWAVRSLAGGEGERFFYPELRPDEIGDGIDLAKLQRTLGSASPQISTVCVQRRGLWSRHMPARLKRWRGRCWCAGT